MSTDAFSSTGALAWAFEHARKHDERERLPILPIKLKMEAGAKDNRIRGLSYFFKKGCVILREGLDDLKKELNRYPGNTRSKDDLLDALSMQRKLIPWGSRPNIAPKWERKKEKYNWNPKKRYKDVWSKEAVEYYSISAQKARMQANVRGE